EALAHRGSPIVPFGGRRSVGGPVGRCEGGDTADRQCHGRRGCPDNYELGVAHRAEEPSARGERQFMIHGSPFPYHSTAERGAVIDQIGPTNWSKQGATMRVAALPSALKTTYVVSLDRRATRRNLGALPPISC